MSLTSTTLAVRPDVTLRTRGSSWRTARSVISRLRSEAGMSTAEYAVGTVAACSFAGILLKLLTSDTVMNLLTALITRALQWVL
jgi:hypothetical protein